MEETTSMLSSGATENHESGERSDSNSSIHQFPVKYITNLPTASKFKGVVSQQNGHWGAQIYANHQRIWLGTFKSEKEAAMAYDSAAIKLRNGDSQRNFPWNEITLQEPNFQNQFSTDEVLIMIKDGSYTAKFSDYLKSQIPEPYVLSGTNMHGIKLRQLFQKELTPSDVGNLNRLVIPKKYAVKYFPPISENCNGGGLEDVELVFYDRSMRSWKFRYCYWKSSQSFVFTRGWNRFAKEKKLNAKDRVIFSAYECGDGLGEMQRMCVIDVGYSVVDEAVVLDGGKDETLLELELGQPAVESTCEKIVKRKRMDLEPDAKEKENSKKGGFKLFGVQII